MFADATAGTELWIHKGKLQANLYMHETPRGWRVVPGPTRGNGHGVSGVTCDLPAMVSRLIGNRTVIIARCELAWLKGVPLELHHQGIGLPHQQHSTPQCVELLPREDGLGAGWAVLLANDARPVHGPGEAAAPIDESGSHPNRAGRRVGFPPELFIQADGTDGCRRTDPPAGYAIELTTARADAEVQDWRPETLRTGFHPCWMNDIRRADAHALTTPEASSEKAFLRQGTRRPDDTGMPILAGPAAQAEGGDGCYTGQDRNDEPSPGEIRGGDLP